MVWKYATVYGGAMNITDTPEYIDSIEIGKILTESGYVVKNGGYRGIMEAVSKGATESGGKVIGYTCKSFGSTKGNKYLSANLEKNDIYDRLRGLIEGSELFIVQKGGVGTLAELFLTWDVIHHMEIKPKVILIGMFWVPILASIESMLPMKGEKHVYVLADSAALKEYLAV